MGKRCGDHPRIHSAQKLRRHLIVAGRLLFCREILFLPGNDILRHLLPCHPTRIMGREHLPRHYLRLRSRFHSNNILQQRHRKAGPAKRRLHPPTPERSSGEETYFERGAVMLHPQTSTAPQPHTKKRAASKATPSAFLLI